MDATDSARASAAEPARLHRAHLLGSVAWQMAGVGPGFRTLPFRLHDLISGRNYAPAQILVPSGGCQLPGPRPDRMTTLPPGSWIVK